jgi:hypothetical protein
MPGRKLVEKLRAGRPGLGVVLMSGYPQPAGNPGFPFVAKPFRPDELLTAVRQAMPAAAVS